MHTEEPNTKFYKIPFNSVRYKTRRCSEIPTSTEAQKKEHYHGAIKLSNAKKQ